MESMNILIMMLLIENRAGALIGFPEQSRESP